MAEHANAPEGPATDAGNPPKDPIVQGSILWPTFLAMIALLLSTAWSLYDEGYTRKQYKKFQDEWVTVARKAYGDKLSAAEADYRRVTGSAEFKELESKYLAARAVSDPEAQRLTDRLNKEINPRLAVLAWPVKVARSEAAALTYRFEHATAEGHEEEARRYLSELKALKEQRHELLFPAEPAPVSWNFQQMDEHFTWLKTEQGVVQGQIAEVNRETDQARAAMNAYKDARLRGPSPDSLRLLVDGLDSFIHEIKQIHLQNKDGQMYERCESCHLATRSPVDLSLADVGGRKVFTSHPRKELLQTHDPERFGCTPCHMGNGIAVSNPKTAHGRYKHWLWPMHYPENIEAGCVQCHKDDIHLDGATGFNRGKQLFYQRGCWGCHRYEGFGREGDEQKTLQKNLEAVATKIESAHLELGRLKEITDDTSSSTEDVEKAFQRKPAVEQELHLRRTEQAQVRAGLDGLEKEVKRIGPNLKEVKAKLRPEWLHSWLMDPRGFRPETKMPRFRLDDEQAWNVAAFLWQSSAPKPVPAAGEGDVEKGETLFVTRGCLGCHSIASELVESVTAPGDILGKGWAADLSRVGEKAVYEYIASWVKDPREHNKYTVMPSLRLSDEDARDIAAWLVTKKQEDATYPAAADALKALEDPARKSEGERLVKHFGCAGCHEIQGLENEKGIGTELTEEGSKPLERLDFGTQGHDYKHTPDPRHADRKSQYDAKGFFENKLRDPATWDKNRHITDWHNRLKMPSFYVRPSEPGYEKIRAEDEKDIDALTTFLLGSVEQSPPPFGPPQSFYYKPADQRKDIQDGWWVIKKYNCDGCHQILPGETPAIWQLPIYQTGADAPAENGRPPTLVGEGSRVDPAWLSKFLDNPALTQDPAEMHRNGVRQAMAVRMPTFFLSERERGKLVRFFAAMAKQSPSYVRPPVKPFTPEELDLARTAFTAGLCANCHLLGGETNVNPGNIYAPSFQPVGERIRPDWIHRWVTQPQSVIPGTAMPAILERETGPGGAERWVVKSISDTGRTMAGAEALARLAAYPGDHADLLRRYFALWNETEAAYQKSKRAP